MRIAISLNELLASAVLAVMILASQTAGAVPMFQRQTGMACASCHAGGNYLELTSVGREFKLMGYTLGQRQMLPLSGMALVGSARLRNQNGSADPASDLAHDGATQLQQVSLFTGGRITDHLGAMLQWTYDGVAHHSALDNSDLRYARQIGAGGKDLLYGITLNNNPSVQDVFNTTPAWGFPYVGPGGAFQGYGAQPVVMGAYAQQVAGLGAYADWNNYLYAELSGYKTANGVLSFLRAGTYNPDSYANASSPYVLKGVNPYWRLAWHGDRGPHSWELGTFGMNADQYSNGFDGGSPLIRYRDLALDAQYQYALGPHAWSAQGTYIHEKQKYDAALVGPGLGYDNASNTLKWAQIKGGYTYRQKYGASLALFSSSGSRDAQLYAANTNPVPDTRGYILEFDYLPVDRVKLGFQYTGYNKFNGASSNYDASGTFTGRNASDNNTLYFFGWAAF